MSGARRLAALALATAVLAVVVASARGQGAPPAGEGAAIALPTDPRLEKKLQAAEDYLKEHAWNEALRVLQSVLDAEHDAFLRRPGKERAGKEPLLPVSVRAEADRLLAGMPPEARELYERLHGPEATALLKQAGERNDPELLARVVVRLGNTRAGVEALRLLATREAAAGNLALAARRFGQLLARQGPREWPAGALYAATRAFRHAGDREQADLTWKLLQAKAEQGKLQIGDRTRTLAEWEAELRKPLPPGDEGVKDWPLYRRDPARSDRGNGDKPYLSEKEWGSPTSGLEQVKALVGQAVKEAEGRGQPVIPGFFPVAADGKVIYRDYWGIRVRDLRTGSRVWESDSRYSLERMLDPRSAGARNTWVAQWAQGYLQMTRPGMLYENSVVGTLSTDGARVFAVEDLYVPPDTLGVPGRWRPAPVPPQNYGELKEAVYANQLNAYNLRTGKLAWYVDARVEQEGGDLKEAGEQDEGYFLGPPLPLHGQLYALSQKNQDLRLLCLDPTRGQMSWVLPLATMQTKLSQDAHRRTTAAHLAYGEGILVCPTNAGMLLGVDLLSHSVVWAHPYREKGQAQEEKRPGKAGETKTLISPGVVLTTPADPKSSGLEITTPTQQEMLDRYANSPGMRQGPRAGGTAPPGGRAAPGPAPPEKVTSPVVRPSPGPGPSAPSPAGALLAGVPEWHGSGPVVQDGRVVFTARDSTSVRCLNLADGRLLWKAERSDDDLYLAGVSGGKVLLVGRRACRALGLADGSKLWQVATGLPSGHGVFSGHLYYLPLKEGPGGQPEVCALDVDTGKDVSHTRSRQKQVPGNLVFYEGDFLSQTVEEVAAFAQLRVKLERIDGRLAKDPHDPVGLTERAGLRMDNGDLPGAIDDLRTALKNQPPAETREKARDRLYEVLTDYLTNDFNAAERYLPEYKALCKVEAPDTAPAEEKQRAEAERRRRLAGYFALVARGREGQGRLAEALEGYLEFGRRDGRDELVRVPDDPALRMSPDVWAQGRISTLVARANPRQREGLERAIDRRWDDLKDTDDLAGLRAFVRLIGPEFRAGREARLLLAERLVEGPDRDWLLEAEQYLLVLARRREERTSAARAVEALARLSTRHGLLEDAVHYCRILGRDFGDVRVRDGKTGADLLKDLATDKRFLPYVGGQPDQVFHQGRVELSLERGQFPPQQQLFTFEPAGDVLPFFARLRVALETGGHTLRLSDRANDDVRLQTALPRTNFVQALMQQGQATNGHSTPFAYETAGHVIVLPVGHLVFGIDPLARRVLWQENLLGASGMTNPNGLVQTDPHDGSVQVLMPDGYILRLGRAGPARPGFVCLQTRDGLKALDPLTGHTLWARTDVPRNVHVFGDDRHVFLVARGPEGKPTGPRVFRANDGTAVPDVPDFGPVYGQRRHVDGHRILAAEERKGGLPVRLYDILTGKDVWKRDCPAGSVLLHCEDPHLGGVVEPDGSVTVLDLQTAREVLKSKLDPEGVDKARGATLLHDRAQWYLAVVGPQDVANGWGGPVSAFQPGSGYRCVPVNGKVYAFDRATGQLRWGSLPVPQQMLVLEQFNELPVLVMASRYNKIIRNGVNAWAISTVAVTVLDKETGKMRLDRRDLADNNQVQPFHTMRVDPREGKIELISFNLKITLGLVPTATGGP